MNLLVTRFIAWLATRPARTEAADALVTVVPSFRKLLRYLKERCIFRKCSP